MEEVELLREESIENKVSPKMKYTIISITCVVAFIFVIFLLFGINFSNNTEITAIPYTKLPSKYFISSEYATSLNIENKIQKSWVYTAVDIMQSLYKYNGMKKGYFNSTQFVKFSPQYISEHINAICAQNPTISPCNEVIRSAGIAPYPSVEDFVKFIKNFPNIFIPESACKLSDNKCNVDQSVHIDSPISFKLTNSTIVSTIAQMKHLLYTTHSPVGVVMPMPSTTYMFPCTNNLVSKTEICTSQISDFGPLTFMDSFEVNGSSCYHNSGKLTLGNTRSLVFIGWDDDYVEDIPTNITMQHPFKGALFFKGTWGQNGHSREYLSGKLSKNLENTICPNSYDPLNYVPATVECFSNNRADLSRCSRDISKSGATPLTCINRNFCSEDKTYFLIRESDDSRAAQVILNYGIAFPRIASFDGTQIEILDLGIPFNHLYHILVPEHPKSQSDYCGHVAILYRTLQELQQLTGPHTDTIRAVSIEGSFSDDSYPGATKKKTHEFTKSSIHNFAPLDTHYHFLDL